MNTHELYTPKYHSLLKWALAASFIMFALYFWIDYSDYQEYLENPNRTRTYINSKIAFQFYTLAFWSLVGLSINKLKEGLIAYLVSLLLIAVPSHLMGRETNLTLVFVLLKFVPALVFGSLIFKDKRRWQVLWLVLIVSGASLINYSHEIIDMISRIFRRTPLSDLFKYKMYGNEGTTSYREFHILRRLLQASSLFVAIAASSWFIDRIKRGIKPVWRSLDLSVKYGNLSSTAIFIITKWIVIIGGISIGQLVVQRGYMPNGYIMNIRFALSGLENVFGFFAVAAFFRCFLAEFLLSRGYKLSWHFFWLMIPIIGELVWLVSLTYDTQIDNVETRLAKHKVALIHYPEGLRNLLYFLALLGIFLSIHQVSGRGGEMVMATLILGIVSFVFLAIYFASSKTIYWIIGLTIVSIVLAIFFKEDVTNVKFQFDNRVTSISNAIIFMVLFHLNSFKVYPNANGDDTVMATDRLIPYEPVE